MNQISELSKVPVAFDELPHKETQFEEMPGWEAVYEKVQMGKFEFQINVCFLSECQLPF